MLRIASLDEEEPMVCVVSFRAGERYKKEAIMRTRPAGFNRNQRLS